MPPSPFPTPTLLSSNPHSETLAQLAHLHDTDKHFAVSRLLSSLDEHLKTTPTPDQIELCEALSSPYFTRLRAESVETHRLRAALNCTEGWTPSYTSESTRVWYRREEHTASHSILTEGTIRAPLANVAVLIYEADLYSHLFWYVSSACALPIATLSLLKRAAHISLYAPWPLYNRDIAIYAYAVDALDEEDGGSVMVVSRSLHDADGVEGVPEPVSRTVRADIHGSGFELIPIEPGIVKAKFLYNVDPKLSFVPTGLINWAARTLCRWSLRTLESRARDLSKMPKEYEERLASMPVYEHIRTKLNQFWLSKGISAEAATEHEGRVIKESRLSENFDPAVTPGGPPASVMKSLLRGDRAGRADQEDVQTPEKRGSRLSRLFYGAVGL